MELKLVILSLACLSCLMPPVYGHPILAAKLAAAGALKGAALLGAGALAKGAILKGAALLAAKGAVLGGAALLGAKALKAGAALAAAKPVLLPSSVVVQKPVLVDKPVLVQVHQPSVVISPPSLSNIGEKLNGLITATRDAVVNKTTAVGELLASLLPSKTIVSPPKPVVYQIVSAPRFYSVPIVEKIVKKK